MFLSSSTSDDSASARLSPMPRRLSSSLATPSVRRLDPLAVLSSLTARDRAIIDLLDEHEVFTTDQLARVFFSRLDVAQRRLLRLTRLTVLDRFRWQLPVGSESWHYVLGPIGATLAAARREVDAPPPSKLRTRTMRLAVRPQLEHLLGLNGWFCDLAAEARRRPDARLSRWWSERRCAERFGTIVRPDAFATYVDGDRRADFYFEYDAGTETLARVARKVARYADLLDAGGPKAPVLIWCASAVRERHLVAAIKKEHAANLSACVVATGSAEARILLGSELGGASWLVPGEEGRLTLFDLASAARGPDGQGAIDEADDVGREE
jgi:hypothetical protein